MANNVRKIYHSSIEILIGLYFGSQTSQGLICNAVCWKDCVFICEFVAF